MCKNNIKGLTILRFTSKVFYVTPRANDGDHRKYFVDDVNFLCKFYIIITINFYENNYWITWSL